LMLARLATRSARHPLEKCSVTLAMSSWSDRSLAPRASTRTTLSFTRESTMSMSWIIRSSTTPTWETRGS